MQSAPTLTTRGMGTTCQAGDYGTIQAGATQSSFDAVNAWRYRFGYNVDVSENLNLGYTQRADWRRLRRPVQLRRRRRGHRADPQHLSAGVPIHGWGTLSGTPIVCAKAPRCHRSASAWRTACSWRRP